MNIDFVVASSSWRPYFTYARVSPCKNKRFFFKSPVSEVVKEKHLGGYQLILAMTKDRKVLVITYY